MTAALGEIEQLVDRYVGAIDEAMQASELAAEEYVPNEPRQKREREAQAAADATGTARTALLAAIRRAIAERDERIARLEAGLRDVLADIDGPLAEADNIAAGRKGMQVSYHGPFAAGLRLPSVVRDLRYVADRLRALADGDGK